MFKTTTDATTELLRTVGLTRDERHELLKRSRTRSLLAVLAGPKFDGREDVVELSELATAVADYEEGVDESDEEAVEHVMTSLHHLDLPRLADYGVCDYDQDAKRVRL